MSNLIQESSNKEIYAKISLMMKKSQEFHKEWQENNQFYFEFQNFRLLYLSKLDEIVKKYFNFSQLN